MDSSRSFTNKCPSIPLQGRTSKSTTHSITFSITNLTSSGKNINRGRRMPQSAAERVLSIPELVLLVFQQASPWTWPTLCLLSRTCNEIVQPHVWKTVSCNSIGTFRKIFPHIRKHADYVETLRINTLPESSVSDLVREISPIKALPNLTSLSIRHSKIPVYHLSSFLAKLPQLKEIVLQECSLSKNPLEVLAQCKNIESMAFNYGDILLRPEYGFQSLDTSPAIGHHLAGF
ncbi:MAG: hypothetical protein J3Q66DRAFT_86139 [Benniella sp.]|nr:MAG: hypothetical protein J3Q66DRAFT_86139 [Benniella sp.]